MENAGSRLSTGDTTNNAGPGLSTDELYDTLSNERRRACVRHLADTEGWVRVKAIASAIAPEIGEGDDVAEESVYISLIQVHMPKLESYDVIQYDSEEKLVRHGPAFDAAFECLAFHDDPDESGPNRVPLLAVATAGGVLATLLLPSIRTPLLLGLLVLHVGILGTTIQSVRETLGVLGLEPRLGEG